MSRSYVSFFLLLVPAAAAAPSSAASQVLWIDPEDIASRQIFYGPGGELHQPRGVFHFVNEDRGGTNPKFIVADQDGVKWTVKLGAEARPETAASRLIWGAGYFADEDYLVRSLRVMNMPAHLRRGQKFVDRDGALHDVRLKRHIPELKKISDWSWSENPFVDTRELNGLRVLMALVNNWDLTDENNAIAGLPDSERRVYLVSDVGSTFGSGNLNWPLKRGRGDLHAYAHSHFIDRVHGDFVDFHIPSRPSLFFLATPREFMAKMRLRWIGKHIPRSDARWIGELLDRIPPDHIRDAFYASGYPPDEVGEAVKTIRDRIAALNAL